MNDCLYAIISQELLQCVPMVTQDRINMEHTIIVVGLTQQRRMNVFNVIASNLPTSLVVLIEIFELNREDSSLNFIEARVTADIIEYILSGRAIVGNRTNDGSETVIVRRDSSCIAKRPKVLTRIKTVGSSMSERTRSLHQRRAITVFRGGHSKTRRAEAAMSLRIIFNEEKLAITAYSSNILSTGTTPIQMDNENSLCSRRHSLPNQRIVNLQRINPRFHKDRIETVLCYRQDRSNIGIGRHNHVIALIQQAHFYVSTENQRQCVKPICNADAMFSTDVLSVDRFESCSGFPPEIPPRVNHSTNSLMNFPGMHRRYTF